MPARDDGRMAKPPGPARTSLRRHLAARARERRPRLAGIAVRCHGELADVTGQLADGATQPLMRPRHTGPAARRGLAIHRAGHDDHDRSALPAGHPFGTPQETLDRACGLYLGGTTARLSQLPPANLRSRPLVSHS
jgi:hypothetical protein